VNYKNRFFELPQNRVWRSYQGGRILDELVGKAEPCDSHFPEDWVGSVTAASNPDSTNELEGISKIQLEDQTLLLPDLIAKDPEYWSSFSMRRCDCSYKLTRRRSLQRNTWIRIREKPKPTTFLTCGMMSKKPTSTLVFSDRLLVKNYGSGLKSKTCRRY